MITKEKYLKAKEIVEKYSLENKKKVGRPSLIEFSNEEINNIIESIFSGNKKLKYIELIYSISNKTNLGITSCKKLAKELKKNKLIQQESNRGVYFKQTTK